MPGLGVQRVVLGRTRFLVAVAVGAGWLGSVGVTLTGGGEASPEAATVLTAFVLLGLWFELRPCAQPAAPTRAPA